MESEDSYVVRIYRRARDPDSLTGIVEYPGTGERAAFHDIGELRSALLCRPHRTRPENPKTCPGRKVTDK